MYLRETTQYSALVVQNELQLQYSVYIDLYLYLYTVTYKWIPD